MHALHTIMYMYMYVYMYVIMFVKEPKLTRSRVRQAVASSVASGSINPKKIVSLIYYTPLKHHMLVPVLLN